MSSKRRWDSKTPNWECNLSRPQNRILKAVSYQIKSWLVIPCLKTFIDIYLRLVLVIHCSKVNSSAVRIQSTNEWMDKQTLPNAKLCIHGYPGWPEVATDLPLLIQYLTHTPQFRSDEECITSYTLHSILGPLRKWTSSVHSSFTPGPPGCTWLHWLLLILFWMWQRLLSHSTQISPFFFISIKLLLLNNVGSLQDSLFPSFKETLLM